MYKVIAVALNLNSIINNIYKNLLQLLRCRENEHAYENNTPEQWRASPHKEGIGYGQHFKAYVHPLTTLKTFAHLIADNQGSTLQKV